MQSRGVPRWVQRLQGGSKAVPSALLFVRLAAMADLHEPHAVGGIDAVNRAVVAYA